MIQFLDNNFTALNTYISALKPGLLLLLVDENTHEHCLPRLLANLETTVPFEIIEIEAGEDLKNIQTANHLWEILAEFKTDRNALMMNIGGGVITDMGGFVASTYKRGIKFINIPTSLLAMCDASLGGKTGIDLGSLKNMVGTFSEAEEVFVFPEYLSTLPFTELRSGFAEMLKHGLIADEKHFKDLISIEELSAGNLFPHVETSMKIKQDVVEEDFREQNIRKTLNFGHTFGHAFESLFLQSGNPIPHGEGVAMGMICESYLSYLSGFISEEDFTLILNSVRNYFPYQDISAFSTDAVLDLMLNDKKNLAGKIKFSLLEKIGKGNFNIEVEVEKIKKAILFYRNLNSDISAD